MNKYFFRFFGAIIYLVFSTVVFSQEISEDLEKKIDFIYQLAVINLDEAIAETTKLENNIDDFSPAQQTSIYFTLVDLYLVTNQEQRAIESCQKALQIATENQFETLILTSKYYCATAHVANNDPEKALEIYEGLSTQVKETESLYINSLMQVDYALLNKKFDNNRKALNLLLKVKSENNKEFFENSQQHQRLLLEIADLYHLLGLKDSSSVYLKLSEDIRDTHPDDSNFYMVKTKGNIMFVDGKYKEALQFYNAGLEALKDDSHLLDLEIILKKSQCFFLLEKQDSTAHHLELILKTKDFEKQLSIKSLGDFYKLYADFYKELGDLERSEEYFAKYMKAMETFNQSKFKTQEGLHEIKTSEIIAQGAQTEEKYKNYIAYISTFLGFVLIAGAMFYSVKAKKDKKRFQELMATVQTYEQKKEVAGTSKKPSIIEKLPRNIEREAKREKKKAAVPEVIAQSTNNEEAEESIVSKLVDGNLETSPIKDEKVQELLEKLEKLKLSGYFLRQDSSLYNTAKRLKTNTSYLSSVINNTMNTNFNRYVNDIRMEFVIIELKNNNRIRSYSVQGIAEEIGYKSADSFTKYFKESTGLTPSAFIRKLNKEFKI